MNSIPATLPFHFDASSTLWSNAAASLTASPTQSFASHLKESTGEEESSQATEQARPKTIHHRDSKEIRHQKPSAAGTPTLAISVAVQQAEDPRSLLPSLPKQSGANSGGLESGAAAKEPVNPAASAHVEPSAALQKNQIAFSVSLPKMENAKTAPAPESPTNTVAAASKASHDQDKHHSDTSDSNDSPGPKTALFESAPKAQTADNPLHAEIAPAAIVTGTAASQSTLYSDTNLAKNVAPAAPAEVVKTMDIPPTPVSRPPQSIDIKVAGADNNQVDVRVSQRAGDVQVTVRTPDNNLAESLRQHLPELSDRLAQSGVSSDIWQPASAQPSADTAGNQESWNSDQSQAQQQQSNSNNQSNESQENEGQSSRWWNEFNTEKEER